MASSRRARSTGRRRTRRDHATPTSTTDLTINNRLPQLRQQRLGFLQIPRVEAFGEPGVERGEEGAGRVALALALPETRQTGGGAQLERLGLLPPGDLQGEFEALFCCLLTLDSRPFDGAQGRLLTVDCLQKNLCPQPVELGIVEVLSLLLGLRDAECERAQGLVVAPDLPEAF